MNTMHVVLVGPDRGLGAALESHGAAVARIVDVANAETLGAADIDTADLLVLTDAGEATAVPVALEANPRLRVVVFAPGSLPAFVRGQVDLALSPDVLDATIVAEELARAP